MDEAVGARVAKGIEAVRAQVGHLHAWFARAESEWKHDGSRVTAADLAISRALLGALAVAFPEDEFLSEETDPGEAPRALRARFAWVLDPIDGTNNYALGIPFCAISLALLDDGVPACGFIYDLGLRVLFHGGPGLGLFEDGAPVARRLEPEREERIVALHAPVSARHLPLVNAMIAGYKVRAFGSGALHLAYVALGRIDACVDLTVKVWDIAAAWAFCRVTGIEVHFLDGPVFPLRTFDVGMKPLRYLAAIPEEAARFRERVAGVGVVAAP